MGNPVNWFEIYVQDMARAKRFYEQVLGVTFTRLGSPEIEMWGFPSDQGGDGASGSLVRAPGVPSGGNSTLVYFRCADCAVEAARVEAAGGRVHRPKMSIGPYGHVVLAVDTDGNMFGLHSMQ
ncbi:MAG: VOC family protein [Acidimicrobiia bacterium]|nr:VOC family protein [Acidimicrobiia bacterium]